MRTSRDRKPTVARAIMNLANASTRVNNTLPCDKGDVVYDTGARLFMLLNVDGSCSVQAKRPTDSPRTIVVPFKLKREQLSDIEGEYHGGEIFEEVFQWQFAHAAEVDQ